MASLPSRATASFDAIKPVSSLVPLDNEFNQLVGAAGILNGGTTGTKLLVKTSDATDPPIIQDQVGAGKLLLLRQNGVDKVTVSNAGLITMANTGVNPGLNADQVDGIEGANIAKLDTHVTAFSIPFFYANPPAGGEAESGSVGVFICPVGTAITLTKAYILFRAGSHTSGGNLTFQLFTVNSDGTGVNDWTSNLIIQNSGPAISNVLTLNPVDRTMTEGQYLCCRLLSRSGTITEQNITVVAAGTQRLT
jgi:hypothetical protein